jgi:hypothetical protein
LLPFLKNKQEVGMSASVDSVKRKSDNPDEDYDVLESAAEDLCNAVHAKDYKAAATALRAAFDLLESESHQEGPSLNV